MDELDKRIALAQANVALAQANDLLAYARDLDRNYAGGLCVRDGDRVRPLTNVEMSALIHGRPTMGRRIEWFECHDNVCFLGRILLERGFSSEELFGYFERPWAWGNEWEQIKRSVMEQEQQQCRTAPVANTAG